MPYCIYLRKSRLDLEAEARGDGDQLARHETILLNLAKAKSLTVTQIYRELVSGDTIVERPLMQRVLLEVEKNLWEGVLVMEVERLARGATIDQGLVAQAFEISSTLIVTPIKTYDPTNEYDMEFFEYGLFQSRREYKTITRRQQGGRTASVNEGKWPWNRAPYGYRRVKLVGKKGWTLEQNLEEANIISSVFDWYTSGYRDPEGKLKLLGVPLIVRRLNELGVKPSGGKDWTNGAVRDLLKNPAYAGWVSKGKRAHVRQIDNGVVVKTRPRAGTDKVTLVRGLHEPIVTQDIFTAALSRLARNPSRPGPKQVSMTNPLSGLIYCGLCGRSMVRRPYTTGQAASLLCSYTSCPTVSSNFDVVENAVITALKNWLHDLELGDRIVPDSDGEIETLKNIIASLQKDLDTLRQQENRAYDLVEQGTYTPEVFLDRTREITRRRADLQEKKRAVQQELDKRAAVNISATKLVPSIRHVLDTYDLAASPEEKNTLLKSVLDRAVYTKTVNTRWHPASDDLQLILHPKIPQHISKL